jgi:DNA-binding transcriptional LysR family regulator
MLIDIISGGGGAAVLPEPMIRPLLADGTLAEVLPRPARTIRFEAAIRQNRKRSACP